MAYSKYYSTADAPKISSIYGTYFMPIKNPLDLDSNVIDMNSYLSRYLRHCQPAMHPTTA